MCDHFELNLKFMAKVVLSFLFFISSLTSCFAQLFYKIEGLVTNNTDPNGIREGDTVSLRFLTLHKKEKAVLKDGCFIFKGSISEPMIAMIEYKGGGTKILLDNSTYLFTLNEVEREENGKKLRSYESIIQTNSKFHNLWRDFYANYGDFSKTKRTILDSIDRSSNKDSIQQLRKNLQRINLVINQSFKRIALENPGNFATVYILPDAPDFSYSNYIQVFDMLSDSVRQWTYGVKLQEKFNSIKNLSTPSGPDEISAIGKKELVGKKIPAINAVDIKGSKVFFSTDSISTPFTLIDFWASWCIPCRKQNINLRAHTDEYKKSGLKIIGFSLDQDPDNWKKAILADNTGWVQITDLKATNSPIVQYLGIDKIPSNVLLNAKGEIVAVDIQPDALLEFVEKERPNRL